MNELTKIIYFDRESTTNILELQNMGTSVKKSHHIKQTNFRASVSAGMKVNLGIPLWNRIKFVFSGEIDAEYLYRKEQETFITSTEISEFNSIKNNFKNFSGVKIKDIKNSSTFFRVASGFLKMANNPKETFDIKIMKDILDSFEGYDVYQLENDENTYVRFNNSAFVSNYKRNDLLTTTMSIYCLNVGKFSREKFDFIQQIESMKDIFGDISKPKTLDGNLAKLHNDTTSQNEEINLYDVILSEVNSNIQGGK